jgi:hypothetical protein
MKAAQLTTAATPAKKSNPFFNKESEQDFFHSSINEQPFFSKSKTNSSFPIQTKLTIGAPNDMYEKEADATADKVVQRLLQSGIQTKSFSSDTMNAPFLQKKCADCEEEPIKQQIRKKPVFESNSERLDDDKSIQRKCAECEKEEKLQKKERQEDAVKEQIQRKPIFESNTEPQEDYKNIQRKCAECEKEEKLQKKERQEDAVKEQIQRKPIFESNTEPQEDYKNIQRKCAECEKEEKLQKKSESTSLTTTQNIESRLSSSKGSGSPLPHDTRAQMESSFDADFSNVRIHNDSSAVQMSKDLNAHAFTHGSDVYFNSGKYDAYSNSGKRLLAHELTHVVQQGASNVNMVNKIADNSTGTGGKDIKDMDNDAIAAFAKPKEGYIKKGNEKIEIHFSDLPSKYYVGPFLVDSKPGPGEESKQDFAAPPFLKPVKKRNTKQGKVWKDAVTNVLNPKFNERVKTKGIKGPSYQLNVIGNKKISVTGSIEEIANQVAAPFWTLDGKSIKYQIEHKVDWQVAGGSHNVDVISNLILLDDKTNNEVGKTILTTMQSYYSAIINYYTKKGLSGLEPDFEAGKGKYLIYTDNLVSGQKLHDAFMISFSNIISKTGHMDPYSEERVDIMDENIPPGHLSLKTSISGAGNIVPYNFENSFIKIDGNAKDHRINSIILFEKNFIKDTNGKSVLDRGGNKTLDSQNPDKKLNVHEESQDHFKVDSFGFSTYLKDNIRGIKALSPIEWESIDFNPMTGLNATGKIVTNVDLLDKADITIEVENSNFLIQAVVTSDILSGKLPKPFNIDYSSLTITAGTKEPFSLTGALGFSIEKLGKGKIAAMAGTNKIGLEGSFLFDQIKQLKKAELGFKYIKQGERTHWEISGDLEVAKDTIKGVESGKLKVKYDGTSLTGEGEAKLTVPGVDKVKINASFGNDGSLTITGGVELKKLPGIKSGTVEITVATNEGEGLKLGVTGEAEPDLPKVPDLNTKLLISYVNGVFEMRTKVQYRNGKFNGTIEVGITNKSVDEKGQPHGDANEGKELIVFGFGSLSVTLFKNIKGTVTVRLTPEKEVLVGGDIEIKDVKPFGEGYHPPDKELVKFPRITIPLVGLPGLSISAFIDGGVYFKFSWDPLVLKELKVGFKEININEIENATLDIHGEVGSIADAEVYLTIKAGLEGRALIATLSGSIGGEAGLGVSAEAGGELDASWNKDKGLQFKEIRAYLNVTPRAVFRLTGDVSVDLDLWITTVNLYYHKWVFAEKQLDLGGLTLKADFPIKFDEENNLILPSLDQINLQKPDFTGSQGKDILDKAINGDSEQELEQKKQQIKAEIENSLRKKYNEKDFSFSDYKDSMVEKYGKSPELKEFVLKTIEDESNRLEHERFEEEKSKIRSMPVPLANKISLVNIITMFNRYITEADRQTFIIELTNIEIEKQKAQQVKKDAVVNGTGNEANSPTNSTEPSQVALPAAKKIQAKTILENNEESEKRLSSSEEDRVALRQAL